MSGRLCSSGAANDNAPSATPVTYTSFRWLLIVEVKNNERQPHQETRADTGNTDGRRTAAKERLTQRGLEHKRDFADALPAALRSLRHRNYQLFFGGQLVSLSGTWMQSVAQSWLIYRLTGSAVLLGLVGFSGQIPVFLLAPIGGAVADRYNRQRILVATQSVAMLLALVLAALTLTNHVREWHIFTLAALLGIVNAFDIRRARRSS